MSTADAHETFNAVTHTLANRLESFCALAAREAIHIEPHNARSLDDFSNYPTEVQAFILNGFTQYHDAVKSIAECGIPLQDTPRSLWHLFKLRDLRPTSDLFSVITQDSVVELYLPNHTQWYRSFNYFNYTSYSLAELICYPWHELVEHDADHMIHLAAVAESLFRNETKGSVVLDLKPTISRERFSARRLSAKLKARIISPISNRVGQNEAGAIVWNIELLSGMVESIPTAPSPATPSLDMIR